MFDELGLTCYTLPIIHIAEERIKPRDSRYKNLLCSLIGKIVQSVAEMPESELSIYFEDQKYITISLKGEDYTCIEAAILGRVGGVVLDVW